MNKFKEGDKVQLGCGDSYRGTVYDYIKEANVDGYAIVEGNYGLELAKIEHLTLAKFRTDITLKIEIDQNTNDVVILGVDSWNAGKLDYKNIAKALEEYKEDECG